MPHIYVSLGFVHSSETEVRMKPRMRTEKKNLILDNNWSDVPRSSGKILNPGKPCFMDLSTKCVREMNAMIDDHGILLVRKAMIRSGLKLNETGCWEVIKLSQYLQEKIQRYSMEFAGIAI